MTKDKIISFTKKYRNDIILIAALLVISLVVLLVVNLTKDEGAYAEVAINGDVVGKYSLDVDGVYSLNGGTNTLTIENGVAYMSYSNCPDHVCENIQFHHEKQNLRYPLSFLVQFSYLKITRLILLSTLNYMYVKVAVKNQDRRT